MMLIIGTNIHQIKVITMIENSNELVKVNHNPTWSYIPYYPYRILIICGLGLGKTNVLFILLRH